MDFPLDGAIALLSIDGGAQLSAIQLTAIHNLEEEAYQVAREELCIASR